MANESQKSTLGEFLGMDVVARHVEKRWLGGYEIRLSHIPIISLWMFLKGVVLGRAKCDHFETLVKMVCKPGREHDFYDILRDDCVTMIDDYGRELNSLSDFWITTNFPSMYNIEVMKHLHKTKTPLGEILPRLQEWVSLGIGFGATYPELVQTMWGKTYETPMESDQWEQLRELGIVTTEQLTFMPLKEMEQQVLLQVAQYASEYQPELVEPLGISFA